jgi:hypothetical protein
MRFAECETKIFTKIPLNQLQIIFVEFLEVPYLYESIIEDDRVPIPKFGQDFPTTL